MNAPGPAGRRRTSTGRFRLTSSLERIDASGLASQSFRNLLEDAGRLRFPGSLSGVVLPLVLAALVAACGGGTQRIEMGEPQEPLEGTAVPDVEKEQSEIVLLFPSPDDDLLHAERRSVVPIESAEARVKLCLEELFRGPKPGLLAAVPRGVEVREVFILPNGTVYADLSSHLLETTGSTRELMAVYSIVDTIALNVRGATRVGILVDGAVHETLSGHVYTGKPLAPDYRYVEESARPQGTEAVRTPPPNSADGDGSHFGGEDGDGDSDASGEDEEEIEIPEPPPADLV